MPKFNTTQLVSFIKAHALTHYNAGWDVVAETYDDAQIAEVLGNASSQKAAIAAFAPIVGAFNEQRDMHRNEALLMGAEPTASEIASGKVDALMGKQEPTLDKVLSNLTDLQKRVIVALLDAGIDCNGCETVDAMRADNMTFADVAEIAQRTGLKKNQIKGVLSGLSGLVDTDVEKPNGQPGVDQVLTDFGVIVAFELLSDGIVANPGPGAEAEKPAKVVKLPKAPKAQKLADDRVIVPVGKLEDVKAMTDGSKRHLLAQALMRGATVEHLMELLGWNKDTVTSAIRWDLKQVGLGCERKGGKYLLIMPEGLKSLPVRTKDVTRAAALVAACK